MILAIPEGYISLKDAFERLLNAWEEGDKLLSEINRASNIGLGLILKDAFERLLGEWGRLRNALEHGEQFIPAVDKAADNRVAKDMQDAAWQSYENAVRRIERVMRDALTSGELCAMVVDESGRISKLDDRERWREMALFPIFGIATVPEPLINPGPDTEGRTVFLETAAFEKWMSTSSAQCRPVPYGNARQAKRKRYC